jgi:E1A/CREB-binding protein
VFSSHVDPELLGVPNYFDVIKSPMDLGTVKEHLGGGLYKTAEDVATDINLTVDNAMMFNEERTVVYEMAKILKDQFTKDFNAVMKPNE